MIEGVTGTGWGYLYWPMSFEKFEEALLICVLIFPKSVINVRFFVLQIQIFFSHL